jgi:glycosyltransferase involved in cell wall biosynthesis
MWGGDLVAAAAVRAARTACIPVVVTPFAHRHQWADDPASARVYRSADRVISLLETDREWYRELGVAEERLEVSGACAPAMPVGGGNRIRSRYEIHGALVLYLGARRWYKGVDVLLQAAEEVAGNQADTTFAFVGPGPRLPLAQRRAHVLDVGEVDDATRAAWLEAADILCLPSASETFGVSILEAWSLQRPVITSDIPALSELIAKSGGGVTAPREPQAFARAILRVLQNPSEAHAMGQSGHRFWAERHTPKKVAGWHERLYRSLIDRAGASNGERRGRTK